jgi:hypothetical protein
MTFFQVINDFNFPFLIIIIFIISTFFLISLVLIIERLSSYRKIFINERKIYNDLKNALNKKNTIFALKLCEKVFSPLANLINAGLNQRNYSVTHIKNAINQATILELRIFEKNLTMIGVLTTFLPFIGLIVLFVTNIKVFFLLESNNISFLNIFSLENSKIIFTFIYVLLCTFLTTFLYYYLVKKKNDMIFVFEKWAEKLVFSLVNKKE